MDVALGLWLAIIAVGLLATWYYGLWRGWRHASRDQTRAERRVAAAGIAVLLLSPVVLAVVGASDRTATIAIAIVVAGVLPVLLIIGVRDHRRREGRIRARRRNASDGNE